MAAWSREGDILCVHMVSTTYAAATAVMQGWMHGHTRNRTCPTLLLAGGENKVGGGEPRRLRPKRSNDIILTCFELFLKPENAFKALGYEKYNLSAVAVNDKEALLFGYAPKYYEKNV